MEQDRVHTRQGLNEFVLDGALVRRRAVHM